MSNTKIACGIIVKDDTEADKLTRCLNTVAPHVDGIFITVTQSPYKEIEKVANQFGANLDVRAEDFNYVVTREDIVWLKKFFGYKPQSKKGDIIFQFGNARQANLDSIPDEYSWLFWIDTDDVLRNGNMLKDIVTNAVNTGVEAVFLNYLYQVDLEGDKIKNVIIQHLRERLVRIDGDYRKVYKWIGNIHETLIQQRETNKVEDQRADILHLSSQGKMEQALARNQRVLELDIKNTNGKDPRPIYYLAKSYYDLHTTEAHKRAEQLILMYLSPDEHENNMSGWREERSQAWEYLAEIYRTRGENNNAIKSLHNALIEYPQFPSTYFSLAISHMIREDYDTARFWAILGSKVPPVKNTLVSNPRDLEARAYEVLYNAGIKLNRIDEAWKACKGLKELFPDNEIIDQQWRFINEAREVRDQLKNYMSIVSHLNNTGQTNKIKALLAGVPDGIANNPLVVKLYQDLNPPREWENNEIALYCGQQFTPWSAKGIENPGQTFIGGSEEAVIYLTRELSKLGWKVTVYADPGADTGEIDGVTWKNYFEFNPRDTFNVLIYWRAVGYVDMGVSGKKTYLWCHDVQNPAEYTKERLAKLDKIIVLSEAHRKNIPDIPDDKIIISSNGFFEHFPEIKPTNEPKTLIWTSSYDRGLQNLLEIWPDVLKEVPDAKLEVFYGWQLFNSFYKNNPERMAWMRKMNELMTQKGITHHGRVSLPEMEKWYKKAGIFAYSSHFYEINCISAIKAQLFGAVPVVMDFAALSETVKYGKKVKGEIYENVGFPPETKKAYTEALVGAIKDTKWQEEQRKLMMPWARKTFNWEKIANEWSKEFGGVKNG